MKPVAVVTLVFGLLMLASSTSMANYTFYEGWETGMVDFSTWEKHGSPSSYISNIAYSGNYSLDINGDGYYFSGVNTQKVFSINNNFRIDYAMRATSQGTHQKIISGFGSTDETRIEGFPENDFGIVITDGLVQYRNRLDSTSSGLHTEALPDYNWHDYSIQYKNGSLNFYRDNSLIHSSSVDLSGYEGAFEVYGKAYYTPMLVDEIKVSETKDINYYGFFLGANAHSWEKFDQQTASVENAFDNAFNFTDTVSVNISASDYGNDNRIMVQDKFVESLNGVDSDDVFIAYLNGHGWTDTFESVLTQPIEVPTGSEYMVAVGGGQGLSADFVAENMKAMAGDALKILIVDACFAGGFEQSLIEFGVENYVLLASSSANNYSMSNLFGEKIFSNKLLEGMTKENGFYLADIDKDGLTMTDLENYIAESLFSDPELWGQDVMLASDGLNLPEGIVPYFLMDPMLSASSIDLTAETLYASSTATPIPGAVWLLGTGLVGLLGFRKRDKRA